MALQRVGESADGPLFVYEDPAPVGGSVGSACARPLTGTRQSRTSDFDNAVTIGRKLRAAREERGLNVNEVAQRLKFKTAYIQALEEGEFDQLPGGYEIGFLKSYVDYLGDHALGVKGADIVESARKHRQPRAMKTCFVEPEEDIAAESPRTLAKVIVLSLTLATLVGWAFWPDTEASYTLSKADPATDIPHRYVIDLKDK